jgi:hypothetical protein
LRKSLWPGFAAYVLPTFLLGYFWHLVTFAKQYERPDLYRAQVLFPLGLGSMLIQAAIFSWAYPKRFDTRRDRWVVSDAYCAVVFGILAWSFTTLPVAAKYRMTSVPDFMMLGSAFPVLQFFVVAPLLALAHRRAA